MGCLRCFMKADIEPSVRRARARRSGSPSMSSRRSGLSSSATAPRADGGNASNHRHASSASLQPRCARGSWRSTRWKWLLSTV